MEKNHCLYFDSFGVGVLEHSILSYLSNYYNSINKLILDQGPILTTTPVGNRANFSSTVGIRSRWSQEPIFKVSSKWVE